MTTYRMHVLVIATLATAAMLAGSRPALAQPAPAAPHGAVLPSVPVVLAQAAAPVTTAPPRDQPIGLPRLRDYEPIAELQDIHFDFGKAVIRPGDMKILDANAAWLRANPGHLLLIEGHCDNRGATNIKNELNMALGERRAQAAMDYLVGRGVDPSRITILSYGEERPHCAEQSERCWSQNRRSRFLVKPR